MVSLLDGNRKGVSSALNVVAVLVPSPDSLVYETQFNVFVWFYNIAAIDYDGIFLTGQILDPCWIKIEIIRVGGQYSNAIRPSHNFIYIPVQFHFRVT